MRTSVSRTLYGFVFLAIASAALVAQQLPTTQPKILTIYREQIKLGHDAAHAKTEAAWPAAYAKANSPDFYLAMVSMTGPAEAWFVAPRESYTAWGKAMARDEANAELTAALDRAWEADAEHLNDASAIEAIAMPDLSHGAYPDLNKARYWDISVWRIRPGHDAQFAQAVTAYKKLASRTAPNMAWRTYRVSGGMPEGSYIMFSSVQSFDQFDAMMAEGESAMKGATPEENAVFQAFFQEGVISSISNKYRLDPGMSYVSAETKATDPAFWNKK